MSVSSWKVGAVAAAAAILVIAGCKSDQAAAPASAGEVSAGTTSGGTGGSGGGAGTSIPTLVNVSLQNVLNDLSVSLQVNRDNIPVTAQVPIDVAANVCGVSVSALAASIASGQAGCTATTTTPQLTQAVQQQIASGGSVGGGDQSMGGTNNMI
ncbi:MAG TPA: hypothetical protein VFP57_07545 [Sphingomicrobium sp.]|jgi:hypothetical protein|nr:hypothetical protein [Sphingomicrobium sp.]